MRRRLVLALWLLGLLLGGGVILRAPFATDMSAFLPRDPRPAQRLLVEQLRVGAVSRLVLLGVAADRGVLGPLSRAFAARLRGNPALALVANGEVGGADSGGLAGDAALLWRQRYVLSPAVDAAHFSTEALHQALEQDARELASPLGMLAKRTIPADPTGEMALLLGRLMDPAGGAHPAMADGVWVSPDGGRALLMVQTAAAGPDMDGQERALGVIAAGFAAARAATPGAQDARLVESGPPVFAVRARARMIGDARLYSAIASVLVVLVLLAAYRSVRLVVLALLPVASGVVAGVAAVALAFGFVHAITLGFGVTLIGEAVDYAIYLFSQSGRDGAPPRLWRTLRLGMAVSVCGFAAMLLSSFTGFAQLGLFTIAGLLVALAVTRHVLPLLRPAGARVEAGWLAWPLRWLVRAGRGGRALVLLASLLALVSVGMHRGAYWQGDLSSLSPLSADEVATDAGLRRDIAAPDVRYLLAVAAPTRQAAEAAAARVAGRLRGLVADGVIAGFDSPTRYLPEAASLRARQQALPDADVLAARLAKAVAGTPFRVASFAPFLADVAAARERALPGPAELAGTALGLRWGSLMLHSEGRWLASLPLRGVARPQALARAVEGFAEPGLLLIDMRAESDRLLGDYLHEAQLLSGAGAVVILLLLAASLRDVGRLWRVVAPLGAAVVCTGAVMLGVDGELSIFNLFGLLLVVAVGSNYCLFLEGLPAGREEGAPVLASLALADVCTVIGFGVLSFSSIALLRGIGGTVALGAVLCLVFAALLWRRR